MFSFGTGFDFARIIAINVSTFGTLLLAAAGIHYKVKKADADTAITDDAPAAPFTDSGDTGYYYFGAKTSYEQVARKDCAEVKIPGCEARQFWLLCRHAARFPGPWEMKALESRLPGLRDDIINSASKGALSADVLRRLRAWEFDFKHKKINRLMPSGKQEMIDLAQRFKQRFPSLLSQEFNAQNYRFNHTDSPRTALSAELFAAALSGEQVDEESRCAAQCVLVPPLKDDPVIKFYKTCRKWKEEVEDNEESRLERERFRRGKEMRTVIANVSDRLGLPYRLSFDEVQLIWTMCRFETARQTSEQQGSDCVSPWCGLLSREEAEVLEYDEDLDFYWTDGYGFDINYRQACPPVKDFLNGFRAVMSETDCPLGAASAEDSPLGIFHFSHSGLMLKVFARLGLFEDGDKLTAENYSQQTDRKWRSSLIDPFNANLAFVLFKCGSDYKMLTYIQEKEVLLPGCDSYLCDMDTVTSLYGDIADTCDLAEICDGQLIIDEFCKQARSANKKYRSILQPIAIRPTEIEVAKKNMGTN